MHLQPTRFASAVLSCVLLASVVPADAATRKVVVGTYPGGSFLPTGVFITPAAAPGTRFSRISTGLRPDGTADANDATATTLSPDGKTLLVLTSGYNTNFNVQQTGVATPITHVVPDPTTGAATSTTTKKSEFVIVYDVSHGEPQQMQRLSIPNTYDGIAWAPDGKGFYVSAGIDDRVLLYSVNATPGTPYAPNYPSIFLGHDSNASAPFPAYDGGALKPTAARKIATGAVVAGIALSRNGKTLAAANMENDSLTIADTATRTPVAEIFFAKPGSNIARGEYPYATVIKSDSTGGADKIYVSSLRDDEVLVVDATSAKLVATIKTGSAPNNMVLSEDGTRLYVADGNSDDVGVVDTTRNELIARIPLGGRDRLKGRNPNGLALSPDGKRLYVTLGGENALAVVDVRNGSLVGRIPTGWYPTGVAVAKNGKTLFVVNEKSAPGADPSNGYTTPAGLAENPTSINQYGWAKEKAGLAAIPTPDRATLAYLSRVVDNNNGVENRESHELASLRGKIKHVIYIVKENRTYDQVLGDIPGTNGDPRLTTFPQAVTPNHHALASGFSVLDNFYDPGESSGVGWNWSTQGATNDFVERSQAVLYGNAGFSGLTYDYQGIVRNVNLAEAPIGGSSPFTTRETGLFDPSGASTILPGFRDPSAFDGDGDLDREAVGGYIWDEALRRGLTIRHYGMFSDQNFYNPTGPGYLPISRTPFASKLPQAPPAKADLLDRSDIYYRAFDQNAPDVFREEEWEREFDDYVANDNLPDLELITLPHDHFGSFGTAIEGLNTPTTQMADNDYALGKLVEKVSHSKFWNSTAIFVLEDDSQSGPDHVDTHRSIALVASPYARRNAIVHTAYTTDNVLKSISEILGLRPLTINVANAAPMTELFTEKADPTPFSVIIPGVLCQAPVDPKLLGEACKGGALSRTRKVVDLHDGRWWSTMTAGMDFSHADRVDAAAFDAVLQYGMTGASARTNVVR